jgi:hypothetical protein
MRGAVSVRLAKELKGRGARVVGHGPMAKSNAKAVPRDAVGFAGSAEASLSGAGLRCKHHRMGRVLKPPTVRLCTADEDPAVVDGRRVFDPDVFRGSEVRFPAVGLAVNIDIPLQISPHGISCYLAGIGRLGLRSRLDQAAGLG